MRSQMGNPKTAVQPFEVARHQRMAAETSWEPLHKKFRAFSSDQNSDAFRNRVCVHRESCLTLCVPSRYVAFNLAALLNGLARSEHSFPLCLTYPFLVTALDRHRKGRSTPRGWWRNRGVASLFGQTSLILIAQFSLVRMWLLTEWIVCSS